MTYSALKPFIRKIRACQNANPLSGFVDEHKYRLTSAKLIKID